MSLKLRDSSVPTHLKPAAAPLLIALLATGASAQATLDPAAPPSQNFDLSAYRLQTLSSQLAFTEVPAIQGYQDRYFFTDPKTGAMVFRTPSGAGHSAHSEYPRVELRAIQDFTMEASTEHTQAESLAFQVLGEPATGKLIFAQIHGEATGTELLKMRWSHGEILMGVKMQPGAREQQIELLHGVALGDLVECQMTLQGSTLAVSVRTKDQTVTKRFSYVADAWSGQRLYFKVGNYTQDKERDGTEGVVAVQQLRLGS